MDKLRDTQKSIKMENQRDYIKHDSFISSL